MKPMMLISILVILLTNVYVAWRVFHVFPAVPWCRWTVVAMMMALSVALPVLFMVGFDGMPIPLAKLLYALTTSWLFIFLYLLMTFLALDILRLVHLMPADWLQGSWKMSLGISAFLLALFVGGNIHYNHKYRVALNYTSAKPLTRTLKVVMASDLHLGYHNGRGELARWVDMINDEHPDLVLIAGDIIDISVRPLLNENMAEELRRIQAPVVACMGNHEYFATEPQALHFIGDVV